MRIIVGLQNIDFVIYNKLHYWLESHANKWIITNFLQESKKLVCIFSTKNESTISNHVISLLKSCFSGKDKKSVTISKFKFNIFINNKINNNIQFINHLKEYFFTNVTDFNNISSNIFKNIQLKYYTKNYLLSLLRKNIQDQDKNKDKEILFQEEKNESNIIESNEDEKNEYIKNDKPNFICQFCNKIFKTSSNLNRHQKLHCNLKINNTLLEEFKSLKSNLKYDLKGVTKITQIVKSLNPSNTIVNSNNNTINIQVNNLSKQKMLDKFLHHVIDIDTFTENYKNDPDSFLSKDESQVLLENSETNGIDGYCEGLSTYLKKKYCLQLAKITGESKKYNECILPYISNDYNLRSHYEKTNNGWILVKSTDKIMKLLNISDQQIYNHHNKFVRYPKKGKKKAINILLRKSDYLDIEQMIKNKEKQKITTSKSKTAISNKIL